MNQRRTLITSLLIAAIMLFGPMQAGAYTYANSSDEGSLTIVMKNEKGEGLGGAEITIFCVASLATERGQLTYSLTDEFNAAGVSIDNNMTSEENIAAAAAFKKYISSNQISSKSITVASGGTGVITGLYPGLYLVAQSVSVNGYRDIIPFLVSLPSMESDGSNWNYNLIVSPKVEGVLGTDREPTPGATPGASSGAGSETDTGSGSRDKTSSGSLPQTGMLQWPVAVLAVSGILIFSLGWADTNSKRKKEKHE